MSSVYFKVCRVFILRSPGQAPDGARSACAKRASRTQRQCALTGAAGGPGGAGDIVSACIRTRQMRLEVAREREREGEGK